MLKACDWLLDRATFFLRKFSFRLRIFFFSPGPAPKYVSDLKLATEKRLEMPFSCNTKSQTLIHEEHQRRNQPSPAPVTYPAGGSRIHAAWSTRGLEELQ